MKEIIKGKRIIGYKHEDGVHWYWGYKEVAVINELRKEIEWCDRAFKFPQEVIDTIRNKVPKTPGIWVIEARRTNRSVTQGNISIFVNGEDMDMHFEDRFELNKDTGKWESVTPDEELGKYVYACLWHKHDDIYHYSDKIKDIFKPDWREE